MNEDRELLELWRQGDRTAGTQLFERHFDSLYRFFRSKVSDGVEDLIQQTFTACVEGRDRVRGEAGFRAYLFGVARYTLYGYFRKRQRNGEQFDSSMNSLHDLDPSPSMVLARRAEEKLLAAALRLIPLELQVTLELHYWEELTTAELAEVLEIPQGTVKSRLRRAKEALRGQMAKLAESGALIESTMADLEHWAAALRGAELADRHDSGRA